jgi:4-alpha-glucanotransferase
MRLIQLLPVNDTSVYQMWWDSYPYSSLSVRALRRCNGRLRATVYPVCLCAAPEVLHC